jgi:hypothetical protein
MGVTMTRTASSSLRRALAAFLAAAPVPLATSAAAQTTVQSSPVGVLSAAVPRGPSGLALPLIAEDLFVGVAESSAGSSVSFATPDANVGGLLTSGQPYYVEVLNGALEGERFDVDVEATIASADASVTLAFGPESNSTLPALGDGALVGARCAVRPHFTLARLQATFDPGLVGHDKALFADGVQVLEQGDLALYFLREDGMTWSRPGSPRDFRDKVLPPDGSLVVVAKSSAQAWLLAGRVRDNAFRKNLIAGFQSFATGFPVDLSPTQVRAFVDTTVPPATRWTGNNLFLRADNIQVLFKQRRPLDAYYLRGNGVTWRRLTGSGDVTNEPILGATDAILLLRVKPDPGYVVPRPFGP